VAVPWRYQARCPLPRAPEGGRGVFVTGSCEPTTTVSGLSSRPDCSEPAITRPARHFYYIPISHAFLPLGGSPRSLVGERALFRTWKPPTFSRGSGAFRRRGNAPHKNGLQPLEESQSDLACSNNRVYYSNPHAKIKKQTTDHFLRLSSCVFVCGDAFDSLSPPSQADHSEHMPNRRPSCRMV
jgi:hypothetical protein